MLPDRALSVKNVALSLPFSRQSIVTGTSFRSLSKVSGPGVGKYNAFRQNLRYRSCLKFSARAISPKGSERKREGAQLTNLHSWGKGDRGVRDLAHIVRQMDGVGRIICLTYRGAF